MEKAKDYLRDISKISGTKLLTLFTFCIVNIALLLTRSILPVFFPIEAELKGVSVANSGLVFGIFPFTVFLTSPFISGIVPKIGVKNSLIIGLSVAAGSNWIFGCLVLIQNSALFVLFCSLVRVIEGFGVVFAQIALVSLIFKIFPSTVGTIIGVLELSSGLGISVGQILGGYIYEVGGFTLTLWFISLTLILVTIFSIYFLKALSNDPNNYLLISETTNENDDKWSLSKGFSFLFNISALVILLSLWLISSAWSYMNPILEPYLKNRFSKTPSQVAYEFFSAQAIIYALFSPIWGVLSDQSSKKWIFLAVGLFGTAVGAFILAPLNFLQFLDTEIFKVLALVVMGLTSGLFTTPSFTALLNVALKLGYEDDTCTYALITGLWKSFFALGETTGPMIGAALYDAYSFKIAVTYLGVVCLIAGVILTAHFAIFSSGEYKKPVDSTEADEKISLNKSNLTSAQSTKKKILGSYEIY